MGRQSSLIKITGKLDDLSFFQIKRRTLGPNERGSQWDSY